MVESYPKLILRQRNGVGQNRIRGLVECDQINRAGGAGHERVFEK